MSSTALQVHTIMKDGKLRKNRRTVHFAGSITVYLSSILQKIQSGAALSVQHIHPRQALTICPSRNRSAINKVLLLTLLQLDKDILHQTRILSNTSKYLRRKKDENISNCQNLSGHFIIFSCRGAGIRAKLWHRHGEAVGRIR